MTTTSHDYAIEPSHKASFQNIGGGGQPGQMGVAVTPKFKESAFWKDNEREEFGSFDHEVFYHHALYVGYNVTNTLYATIQAVKGVWGLVPRKMFTNAFPSTLENAPSQASWNEYRDVTRALWLRGCKVDCN